MVLRPLRVDESKKENRMLEYFGHAEIPMPMHGEAGRTNATCPKCGNAPALLVGGVLVPGYIVVGNRAFGICLCSGEHGQTMEKFSPLEGELTSAEDPEPGPLTRSVAEIISRHTRDEDAGNSCGGCGNCEYCNYGC